MNLTIMIQARQFTSHEISPFFARITAAISRTINIHAIHENRAIIHRYVIARISVHTINIILHTATRLRMIIRTEYLVQAFAVQIAVLIAKHRHRSSRTAHIVWRLAQDLKAQFVSGLFLAHCKHLVFHIITSDVGQNGRITTATSSKAHSCR